MKKPDIADNPSPSALAALRHEIDDVDDNLLSLMAQRAMLVEQIAAVKKEQAEQAQPKGQVGDAASSSVSILRPAREAQQMRKLLAWHKTTQSPIPLSGFLAIWRELIAASVSQQKPLDVYYDGYGLKKEIIKAHFGQAAAYHSISNESELLLRLINDASAIGVLPANTNKEWWKELPPQLQIIAGLPFLAQEPEYLCLAQVQPEPSGDDMTVLFGAKTDLPEQVNILYGRRRYDNECLAAVEGFLPDDMECIKNKSCRVIGVYPTMTEGDM